MMIAEVIAQEILQQLLQILHQTNTNITHKKPNNHEKEEITYTDQNQRSARIFCPAPVHIQLQKWHTEPVSFNVEHTHWSTRADIIIDQHNIYIYCILTPTITYELTDPNSIQNAIKTITQNL